MASSSGVFQKPPAAMMLALRDFVFRHEIFVEAREFDDRFVFTRLPRHGAKSVGPLVRRCRRVSAGNHLVNGAGRGQRS
jgi:hypothetical protein